MNWGMVGLIVIWLSATCVAVTLIGHDHPWMALTLIGVLLTSTEVKSR